MQNYSGQLSFCFLFNDKAQDAHVYFLNTFSLATRIRKFGNRQHVIGPQEPEPEHVNDS